MIREFWSCCSSTAANCLGCSPPVRWRVMLQPLPLPPPVCLRAYPSRQLSMISMRRRSALERYTLET